MQSLILIRGLPSTGKSTLAKALLESSVADKLLEISQFYKLPANTSLDSSDRETMLKAISWVEKETRRLLRSGHTVIVMSTYTKRYQVDVFNKIALQHGVPFTVMCTGRRASDSKSDTIGNDRLQYIEDRFASWPGEIDVDTTSW